MEKAVSLFYFFGFYGQLLHAFLLKSLAIRRHGAGLAFWVARRTPGGAEVHDGLVVRGGLGGVHQFPGSAGEQLFAFRAVGGQVYTEVARQHPEYVAVQHGVRQVVGEGGNGGGGISAHAFELQQTFVGIRKLTAQFRSHHFCGAVQVSGPGVVAEALPEFHDLVFGCVGQSLHRGVFFAKALEIRQSLLHAGLLQDDFRQPDGVGVGVVLPGQGAGVGLAPCEEALGKSRGYRQIHRQM